MKTSTTTRRVVAIAACGAVTAALAWLPTGPASAAVTGQMQASGFADTSSDCTLASGDNGPSSTTATLSHGKRTRSVALDATFTATGDPTDVVHATGHYTGTVKIARNGPSLSKLSLTGDGAVSVDRSKGDASVCDPTAQVGASTQVGFTEAQPGWLYLERTTGDKPGFTEAIVANSLMSPDAIVLELYQGGASHATTRGFVEPGSYVSLMAVSVTAGSGILLKSPPRSTLSMVFHKAGSALTGTKGAGKRYVEFPGSVSCGGHKATLRWKPSASKVAGGAFFVNGKKRASDGTPRGGEKVVLKHLAPKADIKLTAKLQLEGGGHATATRSYVPCKG